MASLFNPILCSSNVSALTSSAIVMKQSAVSIENFKANRRGFRDCGNVDVYWLMALIVSLTFQTTHRVCDAVLDAG